MKLNQDVVDGVIKNALEEDLGERGDITTKSIFPANQTVQAEILLSRQRGVVAGAEIARRVFEIVDSSVKASSQVTDGESIEANQVLISAEGPVQSILAAERTALNFLQHLSGVATLTHKFVDKVKGKKVEVLDTRKTFPGLRILEKYAVTVGGGRNHRFGLYDQVLIKDNHVRASGSIAQAVKNMRQNLTSDVKIEIEVDYIEQVEEAIEAKPDIIMLDNMNLEAMRKAVKMIDGKAIVEASGGITLANVLEVAKTGVDWISTGKLTQAPFLEMSLEVVSEP